MPELLGLSDTNLRSEWFAEVAAAQQRLAGFTLDGDCETFARGVERFSNDLPTPRSAIERRVLRDCVVATLTEAGHHCHRAFHRRCPEMPCGGSPLPDLAPVWTDTGGDEAITRWTREYRQAFSARHVWPPSMRVATCLDRHFREPFDLRDMTHRVACGRTTLIRQFKASFGMTIGQYQRRLRIRRAIIDLRTCGSKIDDVARMLGYRSPKNFYTTLKEQTGLTPADVRNLTDSEIRQLLDVTVPFPHHHGWHGPSPP